jgi:hypothetical protein
MLLRAATGLKWQEGGILRLASAKKTKEARVATLKPEPARM